MYLQEAHVDGAALSIVIHRGLECTRRLGGEGCLGGGRVSTRLRRAVESDEGVGMWGATVDWMRGRFFEVRELNAPAVRTTRATPQPHLCLQVPSAPLQHVEPFGQYLNAQKAQFIIYSNSKRLLTLSA